MRWFTAALAGATVANGVSSAVAFGLIAAVLAYRETGSVGAAVVAGATIGGAVLGMLIEWWRS